VKVIFVLKNQRLSLKAQMSHNISICESKEANLSLSYVDLAWKQRETCIKKELKDVKTEVYQHPLLSPHLPSTLIFSDNLVTFSPVRFDHLTLKTPVVLFFLIGLLITISITINLCCIIEHSLGIT